MNWRLIGLSAVAWVLGWYLTAMGIEHGVDMGATYFGVQVPEGPAHPVAMFAMASIYCLGAFPGAISALLFVFGSRAISHRLDTSPRVASLASLSFALVFSYVLGLAIGLLITWVPI